MSEAIYHKGKQEEINIAELFPLANKRVKVLSNSK